MRGRVPPGRLGPPYVGETLALLRNPFRFVEKRQRRHGNVFKSRILGRPTVFLAGLEGAEAFYDGANISRTYAHPYTITDLFGGLNMEMYDGSRHLDVKTVALTAFDDAAIARYLPDMQRLIEERLGGWASRPEISATAELRKLAIEVICLNLLGLEPGPRTDAICRDYGYVLKGIVSVPAAAPGTPYRRARQARDRLLSSIRALIAERRASPASDGLSQLLTVRTADGRALTDAEATLEVHHIVIAGFIVYALMGEAMRQLRDQPELAARCAAEVVQEAPAGALTLAALRRLPVCTQVVLETKRYVPLVPLAFGRAARTFDVGGFSVPQGWRVYLALSRCNQDPHVFDDPATFDPARFSPERAEHLRHPLAFIPQGAGPPTGHQCLGLEYSTVLVLAFLAVLVRGYTWDLPAQDLAYRWNTIPPEPKDGLRVSISCRGR